VNIGWPADLTYYKLLTDWGGLIGGCSALIAGAALYVIGRIQVNATREAADKEIAATREAISAAQEQTKVAQKQIAVTLRLDRQRVAYESHAFLSALKSAGGAVINNVVECRKMIPNPPSQDSLALYQARQRLPCPLFQDLRPACIRLGSDLTDTFLCLDQDIIAFAAAWVPAPSTMGGGYRSGAATRFHEDLTRIEEQARLLQDGAEKRLEECTAEIRSMETELK
jgi:hypothetical protein